MSHSAVELLLVSLIVAGAATVKGAIGFGFPLVAVPLLSSILGPRVAVPLIAIPTGVSNLIMIVRGKGAPVRGALIMVLAGITVGTVIGALLFKVLDPRPLSVLVGTMTLLYVLATVFRLTVRIPAEFGDRAAPVVGVVTGVIGGATGIFAPPLATYLHMLQLAKTEFVFWITLLFAAGNIVQIASYVHLGLYGGPVLPMSLAACIPMAVGTWVGLVLQDRMDPEVFNRVILAIVFLASLNLLWHGVLG